MHHGAVALRSATVFETVVGEDCCLPNRLYLQHSREPFEGLETCDVFNQLVT
jgi:hypothetical protein